MIYPNDKVKCWTETWINLLCFNHQISKEMNHKIIFKEYSFYLLEFDDEIDFQFSGGKGAIISSNPHQINYSFPIFRVSKKT